MAVQIGILQRVIPLTREAFGPVGRDQISAQFVDEAYSLDTYVGPIFMNGGPDLYVHPGLTTEDNALRVYCIYRFTLEGGEIVVQQHGSSAVKDDRVFRVPPVKLASTPVDNLARLIEQLRHQEGRCGCGDGCIGEADRRGHLTWRRGVLVGPRHLGDFLVLCGSCYDGIVGQDAKYLDRTVIDGRRILPHAALQVLAFPG